MRMSTHEWNSRCESESPVRAPCPARPTTCSEPMFAAKIEAPIASQPTERPPRKKSWLVSCLRRVATTTIARTPK